MKPLNTQRLAWLGLVGCSLPWTTGCLSISADRFTQSFSRQTPDVSGAAPNSPRQAVASRGQANQGLASGVKSRPGQGVVASQQAGPVGLATKGPARGQAIAAKRSGSLPAVANSPVQVASATHRTKDDSPVVLASAQEGQPNVEPMYDPSLARVPMGMGPPQQGGHGPGCACCNHGGPYQPMLPSLMGGECGANCGEACAPAGPRYMDMQEYLFDGGDRWPSVKVHADGEAVGLQPEDTVVHYDTERDGTCVEPACRAMVYAPRFAAVRKVATPLQGDLALGPRAAMQPEGPGAVRERLPSPMLNQKQKIAREATVGVIEGFRDRNRGVLVDKAVPPMRLDEAFKPYEDMQLIREGILDETDRFKLQRFVAAANVWGSNEEVEVLIDGQPAAIQVNVGKAQETVVYEIEGKPQVRICKVASQQMAAPGDEIDFTIRVDNVGERDVKNVVVLDSLAPRLEYVVDSQQSSVKTEFQAVENEVGSHKLEWKFVDGMKPGDGAFIRFRCKVR